MAAPIPSPLILLGFMGCGKSTVGRLLAARLGWHFSDLDERIEAAAGVPINRIFAEQGEPAFRRVERAVLEQVLAEIGGERRAVLALGGGTFAQPDNLPLLKAAGGQTIFLDAPLDVLLMRCAAMTNRPLFRDEATFRVLHQHRLPYYRQAQHTVAADDADPTRMVERILQLFG